MAGQTWDNDIGPWVHHFWTSVEQLTALAKVKGLSNTQLQTLATAVLGQRVASSPLRANTAHITAAQGLAANNYS